MPEKKIDAAFILCYSEKANGRTEVFFFAQIFGRREEKDQHADYKKSEVEVVRTRITLACTECKQRNYNMTKDKKAHPDRMETKKYCRFCKTHTLHKETK